MDYTGKQEQSSNSLVAYLNRALLIFVKSSINLFLLTLNLLLLIFIKFRLLTYPKPRLATYSSLIVLLSFAFITSGCSPQVARPLIDIPTLAPKPAPIKNVNVALVLGAGGSRGLAHLGVIEVLQKEGIPIDLVVGSSAGSLIGALYCDSCDAQIVKSKVLHLKKKDLLDPSFAALIKASIRLTGPIQGNALEQFIFKEMAAKDFSQLKIPLIAVATNVNNNHIMMLRSGPIAPAVHASSALPPIFSPVSLYKKTLIDGGVIAPVPVQVARLFKPKMIIAVDISTPPSRAQLNNGFELLHRALHISFYELSQLQSSKAEVTIRPNLMGYGTFDDQNNQKLYEKGREAALNAIPEIKKQLREKGIVF